MILLLLVFYFALCCRLMVSTFIGVYSKLGNCGVDLETKGQLGLCICFIVDFRQILIAGLFG